MEEEELEAAARVEAGGGSERKNAYRTRLLHILSGRLLWPSPISIRNVINGSRLHITVARRPLIV